MNINKELKDITANLSDTYHVLSKNSRREYLDSQPAGARVPESGKLYTEAARTSFANACNEAQSKINSIFGKVHNEIDSKVSEAPSTEAVNAVSMLGNRDRISEGELKALLNKYGDNVLTHRALSDIARKHDIHGIPNHPIDAYSESVDLLERNLRRGLTTSSADRIASGGYLPMLDQLIDNTFKPE